MSLTIPESLIEIGTKMTKSDDWLVVFLRHIDSCRLFNTKPYIYI